MKLCGILFSILMFSASLGMSDSLTANNKNYIMNKQDNLRIKLTKYENFNPIGKDDCCKLINKWKSENMDDRDYRHMLDIGMRQICDYNVFPIFINIPNSQYIIINLVSENNVNIINILDKKENVNYIDNVLLEYHTFLIQNDYNPNYYELKSQNMKHFLNIFFLNFLSEEENKLIYFKKNDYIKFLEEDTKKRGKKN